ncbi:MAG: hypothetical protein JWN76_3523 [Chitinophagaceae bacterium]|nr:hypothetical protein [Chitinophagaceae bacterium]
MLLQSISNIGDTTLRTKILTYDYIKILLTKILS